MFATAVGGLAGARLTALLADSWPLRAARLRLPGMWSADLAPVWAVLVTAACAVMLMLLPSLAFGIINVLVPLRLDDFGAGAIAIGATFLGTANALPSLSNPG